MSPKFGWLNLPYISTPTVPPWMSTRVLVSVVGALTSLKIRVPGPVLISVVPRVSPV